MQAPLLRVWVREKLAGDGYRPKRWPAVRARFSISIALLCAFACKREEPPGRIVLFDGYGTPQKVLIGGRVLIDPGLAKTSSTADRTRNLIGSFDTLETDELAGVKVEVDFAGLTKSAITDDDGR